MTFDCTYYQSRENKKEYHYLLEELLGVSAHERFSEAAEEKILTEALKTSYEEATKVIPSKSKIIIILLQLITTALAITIIIE